VVRATVVKSYLFFLLVIAASLETVSARGRAEHVVVVVWDGMRPDFIKPQYAPTLYELASRGTFFLNHHSAYVTSTEVNGTALATGMHPDHSGVMANNEYQPDINWLTSYGTESLDAVRRGDLLSQGHYLGAATVAEVLQQAGIPTIIAGAKPVALLQDRSARKTTPAGGESVLLFRGQTVPRSVLETLVKAKDIGAFPADTGASNPAPLANAIDAWTTKALVRGLWKRGVPKYSLLWLSEPDAAQHASGVGSANAITAIESSDADLALVLKALRDKGVLDRTDVFVVSDHGFSTINHGPNVIESLKKSKFTTGTQFQNPEPGDIMMVNLGGSASFYVFDHDKAVIRRLIAYLQGSDFAGVIFSSIPAEGTFPLAQAHVDASRGAPDVLVSMRWSGGENEFGAPGLLTSPGGTKGHGTHASLSPFDLHNTLVAAGPNIKTGFVNQLPSGNIDVAPTVLFLLGVSPPSPMDGRVLSEALTGSEPPQFKPVEKTVEASRQLGFLNWRQHLRFTQFGSATYYDEGNGACRLQEPEPRGN
jgi:predicted AlkP superfamily pyrophosphatase or phosphodiesterase